MVGRRVDQVMLLGSHKGVVTQQRRGDIAASRSHEGDVTALEAIA